MTLPKITPHDFSPFRARHTPLVKGRRIAFYQMEVPAEDGNIHAYDWIDHPGAVVIIPFIDEETIILIENQRPAVGKTLLELPAGTCEEGETSIRTAEREVEEETGYHTGSIDHLFDFYSSPGFCNEVLYAFVAKNLTYVGQNLDPTERIKTLHIPLEEAYQAIGDGRIQDAKTIATLLYYRNYR